MIKAIMIFHFLINNSLIFYPLSITNFSKHKLKKKLIYFNYLYYVLLKTKNNNKI